MLPECIREYTTDQTSPIRWIVIENSSMFLWFRLPPREGKAVFLLLPCILILKVAEIFR